MIENNFQGETPEAIASEVYFFRDTNPNISILYVEGDSDVKLFKHLCKKNTCTIVDCHGRDNVLEVIKIRNAQDCIGEIAIADKDYDELYTTLASIPNLFYTDQHDMETTILSLNDIDGTIEEYSDSKKIEQLEKFYATENIFNVILDYSKKIGLMRLYCIKNAYIVNFNTMPIDSYMKENFKFDYEDYLNNLIQFNSKRLSQREKEELIDNIKDFIKKKHMSYNIYMICRGHDITYFLSLLFSLYPIIYKEGNHDESLDSQLKVEQRIRSLLSVNDFRRTKLYKSIKNWEEQNLNFYLVK